MKRKNKYKLPWWICTGDNCLSLMPGMGPRHGVSRQKTDTFSCVAPRKPQHCYAPDHASPGRCGGERRQRLPLKTGPLCVCVCLFSLKCHRGPSLSFEIRRERKRERGEEKTLWDIWQLSVIALSWLCLFRLPCFHFGRLTVTARKTLKPLLLASYWHRCFTTQTPSHYARARLSARVCALTF